MKSVLKAIAPIHHRLRSQKCELFFSALRPDPGDSLMDVGGGIGILGEFAKIYRFFRTVHVVNLDPQRIEEKGLEHVKCEVADGCSLPFADGSFDWFFPMRLSSMWEGCKGRSRSRARSAASHAKDILSPRPIATFLSIRIRCCLSINFFRRIGNAGFAASRPAISADTSRWICFRGALWRLCFRKLPFESWASRYSLTT